MSGVDYARYERWYPSAWRERYGTEFVSLLEATYAGERVPMKASLSIVRAGTLERARELGIVGKSVSDDRAVTGSALAVLMAWTVFVVVGLVFAKYVEHWQWFTAVNERTLPSVAYDVVAVGAILGAVIAGVAALLVLPALLGRIRSYGWRVVAAPLRRTLLVGVCAAAFTAGIVTWANTIHRAGPAPLWPNRVVLLAWFIVVVAAIFIGTASAGTVVRRVELETRTIRRLGSLALAMNVVLVVIFVGVVTFWAATAANAPWFFSSEILRASSAVLHPASTSSPSAFTVVGSTGHDMPIVLVVIGTAMLGSLLVALYAGTRIASRLGRVG